MKRNTTISLAALSILLGGCLSGDSSDPAPGATTPPAPTDTQAPVLSAGGPTGTLSAGVVSADLVVTSDESASCRFSTQAGVAYANMTVSFTTTGGTNHAATVNGLIGGRTYTYYVRCEDTAGNANASDFVIQFSTTAVASDTTPPVLSSGAPSGVLTAGTMQTNLTLNSNESAFCRYSTQSGVAFGAMGNSFANTGGTSHSTTISGLADGQAYSYFVRCQDSSGNSNASDFTIQFSVAAADTTPPVRSNGAPTGVLAAGTQSVDISLQTDENATCRYGSTAGVAYSQIANQFNGTGGQSHVTTVNGLSDGQQYNYYVRCEDFANNANTDDFLISFSVSQPSTGTTVSDDFAGNGPLLNYTTNNASALPNVARVNGRYRAELTDNTNDITLHFNNSQGRLDAKLVSFPFEYIARNIGIGTVADSQIAPTPVPNQFNFSGIQVHVTDLNSRNSAHLVVGHRDASTFTVEGKNTVNGNSQVNDDGVNIVPSGRADLRVVGQADGSLRWYWQQPNPNPGVQADNWNPYRGTGVLPGTQAAFGSQVYIGLITYAFANKGIPFVGTADSVELVGE